MLMGIGISEVKTPSERPALRYRWRSAIPGISLGNLTPNICVMAVKPPDDTFQAVEASIAPDEGRPAR
jgi:hypothetical protein